MTNPMGDLKGQLGHTEAEITWRDGRIPVSTRFDDPYYSLDNGLAETRHVFLNGNDLPARLRDGFHVAELGFGTGLNLLALAQSWRAAAVPGRLKFTSFEAFPMSLEEAQRAHAAFPELAELAKDFAPLWQSGHIDLSWIEARVVIGDGRETLPNWDGKADAWFLDGFSPARNPELWDPELMQAVGAKTSPDGTFATYTAAGAVRRALSEAGFTVERIPGYGRKRHMTRGVRS
ncbi:MAG: tRNA (5-methylaminomethyl-2-thiouridine)(34)-methyltransferase MnmD [Pseudomonadota bacterium]